MKGFVLSVLVVFAVMRADYGIKCYVCSGSEADCSKHQLEINNDKYLMECFKPSSNASRFTKCMRFWTKKEDLKETTTNCANEMICESTKETCDNMTDGECTVGCCDSDACSPTTSVYTSVSRMTMCSVFVLGLVLAQLI